MPHRAGRRDLKPAQRLTLDALEAEGQTELTRGKYQQLTGVSRSQAAYDLAELVERGLLERVGGGRSTRYRVARRSQPSQRHWTNERIRAALGEFCAGRPAWPSATDFKSAGHADLYVAASRYGGIGFWARELGFEPAARAAQPKRARVLRPRMRWAAAGAALAAVLFGAAGAVLYPWHRAPTRQVAVQAPARHVAAQAPARSSASETRPRAPKRTVVVTPKRTRPARRVHSVAPSHIAAAQSYRGQLVVQRQASPPRTPVRQASRSTGGPAPLAAPSAGGSEPAPLPAP
jgi:putative transcriptional regulator